MLFAGLVVVTAALGWDKKLDWKNFPPHPGENGVPDCVALNMPQAWFDPVKEGGVQYGTKEHLELELKAMIDLYEQSDGDNWPAQWRSNWKDISKGCAYPEAGMNGQWTGLTCHHSIFSPPPPKSAGRHLATVNLPHGLVKTLPASLKNLICVVNFQIPYSQITGTLPDFGYALCNHLFDLSHNQISGTVPDDFLPAPCTQSISLAYNKLEGTIPETLRTKTILSSLKLNNNMFSGTIPEFGAMPELKELDLSNNRFSGTIPKSILNMPKLRWLRLHQNGLSGPIPAEIGIKLPRLTLLDVRGNDDMDKDIPESVSQLALRVFNGTVGMKCPAGKDKMLRHVPESTHCGGRAIGASKGKWVEIQKK